MKEKVPLYFVFALLLGLFAISIPMFCPFALYKRYSVAYTTCCMGKLTIIQGVAVELWQLDLEMFFRTFPFSSKRLLQFNLSSS